MFFAYTDPGSGSLILQLILASIAGILFYFRQIFNWIKSKISSKKSKSKSKDSI